MILNQYSLQMRDKSDEELDRLIKMQNVFNNEVVAALENEIELRKSFNLKFLSFENDKLKLFIQQRINHFSIDDHPYELIAAEKEAHRRKGWYKLSQEEIIDKVDQSKINIQAEPKFYKTKKEQNKMDNSTTNSNQKPWYKKWWVWLIILIILGQVFKNKDSGNSSSRNNSSSSQSEEVSKRAYRAGYSDGQMGYGLPASETATAMESYMAHNYNFSSADVAVYEMGYNDGLYGRSKQY